MSVSLPHERELIELIKLVHELQDKPSSYVIMIISESHTINSRLISILHRTIDWDQGREFRIFRDGVECVGGGRIVFGSLGDPHRLAGMSPSKIALFGNLGEMFYFLKSHENCSILAFG